MTNKQTTKKKYKPRQKKTEIKVSDEALKLLGINPGSEPIQEVPEYPPTPGFKYNIDEPMLWLERWGIEKTKTGPERVQYLLSEMDRLIAAGKPILRYILSLEDSDPVRMLLTRALHDREQDRRNPVWKLRLIPNAVTPNIDPNGKAIKDCVVVNTGNIQFGEGQYVRDGRSFGSDVSRPQGGAANMNQRIRQGLPIYNTVKIGKEPTQVTLKEAIFALSEYGYKVAWQSSNARKGISFNPWIICECT